MAAALRAEELEREARERTGLADFGEPVWRDGLAVLLEELARAELSDLGRMVWHGRLLSHLVQRLRVLDCLARHPEIERQPLVAPVFMVGLPRTGTTALSHLLAQDPATRSLRVWESAEPVPPPETATEHSDPRIETAAKQIELMRQFSPRLAAMHEDTPTGPTENHDLLGMSFRTYHFGGMAFLPGYAAWWLACDMDPAYRLLKRTLQLLQWRCPPARWQAEVAARFVLSRRDPRRLPRCALRDDAPRPRRGARLGVQPDRDDVRDDRQAAAPGADRRIRADVLGGGDAAVAHRARAHRRGALRRRALPRAERRPPRRDPRGLRTAAAFRGRAPPSARLARTPLRIRAAATASTATGSRTGGSTGAASTPRSEPIPNGVT